METKRIVSENDGVSIFSGLDAGAEKGHLPQRKVMWQGHFTDRWFYLAPLAYL